MLALMGTQWERVTRLLGVGSDPALIAAGVTEGDAGLAEGYPQAYASAIEAYGRAIEAGADRDPEVLASLSRGYALAAQAQIDSGATGESVTSLSAAALTTAQSAVALDERELDAKLALSDALRLAADHTEARSILEDARSMAFSRTGVQSNFGVLPYRRAPKRCRSRWGLGEWSSKREASRRAFAEWSSLFAVAGSRAARRE